MICKDKMYIVYEHVSPSNKRYIGITCQPPECRWRHGEGYKNSIAFYNAIKKYGWDNFSHNILFSNLSADEAANKEKELINFYKTTNKNYGYNIKTGGEIASTKVDIEKIQILWEENYTINEIAKILNINRNTVSKYVKQIFNLTSQELFTIGNQRFKNKQKKIMTENIIELWKNENYTQQEIHEITGYNIKTIRQILNENGITEQMRRSHSAFISNQRRRDSSK